MERCSANMQPSSLSSPQNRELQPNVILAFFFFFSSLLQARGCPNLIDRSHLYEPTWKSNEIVIHFCIEICPQILPSSDLKPMFEWTLLCIHNYNSCNLQESDNNLQLMPKHFSRRQAIPFKEKKIAEQPLAPITLPSTHPMTWHTLGWLCEGSHVSGWKIKLSLWNQQRSIKGYKPKPSQQQ